MLCFVLWTSPHHLLCEDLVSHLLQMKRPAMSASPTQEAVAETGGALMAPEPPKTPERKASKKATQAATPKSAATATPKSTAKAPHTPPKPSKALKRPAASGKAKAKAKSSPRVQKKSKTTAVAKSGPKAKPKAASSNNAKKEEDEKDEKDKKDPQKKKGKESLKEQASKWVSNLDKPSEDEEDQDASKAPTEERDRQKAQKFRKLEKAGALPAEVQEAFDAAEKSSNPRANKTQLINSLFRKEGNNFVMVPKDPAFKRVQKLLDVKYGKEESQSYLDATVQLTRYITLHYRHTDIHTYRHT